MADASMTTPTGVGPPGRATGDIVSGLVLAALGVFVVITASGWVFLDKNGPGPGFFPMLYGIALIAVSLALVIHRLATRPTRTGAPSNWADVGAALLTWAAFVAMIPLMAWFGFAIAFAVFSMFMMIVVFKRSLTYALIAAVLSSAAFQLIFPILLDVRLPVGTLTGFFRAMDSLYGLMHGFGVALQPANLLWCVVGCFLGTIIGILPGLGPAATIALLLPLTFNMDPTGGIIMLCGIYYGAKYGGSTTSILLNMPGEASSVVSCIDGYQMARNGRAGAALGIAAIASFIAGTIGVVILTFLAPELAEFALSFSSPEFFALMAVGLSLVVLLAGNSVLKAALALIVGLVLATVGTDLFTAQSRFTFGQSSLLGGFDFVLVAIGVFAIAEVMRSIEERATTELLPIPTRILEYFPSWQELKACRFAFINGSITGFLIGTLPGAASSISSFVSYGIEKAVSKRPEMFGKGAPEGLAAPEAANNSDSTGAMLPLLTFGIPAGGSTAIMLMALISWGYRPGPLMVVEFPDLFWGLIASMYIGNVVLLLMNMPMVPIFAQILRVPMHTLLPLILGVSLIGAYGVSGNLFDIWVLAGFGLFGYVMAKLDYPVAPFTLGIVLGDPMERAVRQSLTMSQGDVRILFERPISAVLLIFAALILASPGIRLLLKRRRRPKQIDHQPNPGATGSHMQKGG